MTAQTALTACTAAGLALELSGDHGDYKLLVSPRSALTAPLRALITQHRDALVGLLYAARVDAEWPPIDDSVSRATMQRMVAADAGKLLIGV